MYGLFLDRDTVDRGITACNVRGYATPAVAQHVFALLLALTTRLPAYQRDTVTSRGILRMTRRWTNC